MKSLNVRVEAVNRDLLTYKASFLKPRGIQGFASPGVESTACSQKVQQDRCQGNSFRIGARHWTAAGAQTPNRELWSPEGCCMRCSGAVSCKVQCIARN